MPVGVGGSRSRFLGQESIRPGALILLLSEFDIPRDPVVIEVSPGMTFKKLIQRVLERPGDRLDPAAGPVRIRGPATARMVEASDMATGPLQREHFTVFRMPSRYSRVSPGQAAAS
jgi:hypothetical protein